MEEVRKSLDQCAYYFLRPFAFFPFGGEGQGFTQESGFVYRDKGELAGARGHHLRRGISGK